MSEYRLVLPKTPQGGFSQSPEQEISNSGSPALNRPLTIKNGIGIGVAAMYGKRVLDSGVKAIIGQIGDSYIEETLEGVTKIAGYGALALVSLPAVGFAIGADMFVSTINAAVDRHKTALENERMIEARGTRRNHSAGGYYD